jgi:hypothetical protein
MGGTLYKNPRMSKSVYEDIKQDVINKLAPRKVLIPESFLDKDSFGDVDVCLELPVLNDDTIMEIFRITAENIHHNTTVVSINYRNAQVDLCHFEPENLQSAYEYMRNSDCSNMVGCICRAALGYRLTHKGLTYPVRLKQEDMLGEVLVSQNFKKILEFIDLNYNQWNVGFQNQEELFEWIIKSKYFNPSYFYYENLNSENRIRNKKRVTYGNFVEWLYLKELKDSNTVSENKQEHLFRGLLHFYEEHPKNITGLWIEQAFPLIRDRYTTDIAKNLFNGRTIQDITGKSGPELGLICREFHEHLRTTYGLTRSVGYGSIPYFIAERTKDEMLTIFNNWYETYE